MSKLLTGYKIPLRRINDSNKCKSEKLRELLNANNYKPVNESELDSSHIRNLHMIIDLAFNTDIPNLEILICQLHGMKNAYNEFKKLKL